MQCMTKTIKSKMVEMRLTEEDYSLLKQKADSMKLPISTYIRYAVFQFITDEAVKDD